MRAPRHHPIDGLADEHPLGDEPTLDYRPRTAEEHDVNQQFEVGARSPEPVRLDPRHEVVRALHDEPQAQGTAVGAHRVGHVAPVLVRSDPDRRRLPAAASAAGGEEQTGR